MPAIRARPSVPSIKFEPSRDQRPPIWRRVSVSSAWNLAQVIPETIFYIPRLVEALRV